MTKKKAARDRAKIKSRVAARNVNNADARDLSGAEQELVSHMEQGWRLETDSLGGNPVLRDSKSDEVIRPTSANRSTVEALEKRGLIVPGKGGGPLTTSWRMKNAR